MMEVRKLGNTTEQFFAVYLALYSYFPPPSNARWPHAEQDFASLRHHGRFCSGLQTLTKGRTSTRQYPASATGQGTRSRELRQVDVAVNLRNSGVA
jgi:hypothetical protein